MKKLQFLALSVILVIFLSSSSMSKGVPSTVWRTHRVSESQDYWPTDGWLTSTPEEQGMNSTLFDDLWDIASPLRTLLVIRNGYIIYEEYRGEEFNETNLQSMYSVTKSFLSALVGMALEDGNITSLDELVVDFFPDRTIANLTTDKQSITVEHLLTMTSGFEMEADDMRASPDWIQFVLDLPVVNPPGTTYSYASGNSHLLSAIVNRSTRIPTITYAENRLFQPLGITDYEWRTDPQGLVEGGAGLNLTARDMAKLGFLWLNYGSWDGEQIVPSYWVDVSTQIHVPDDDEYGDGYGYHWRIDPVRNAYFARGWRTTGHYVWVQPENDLVVVFTISGLLGPFDMLRDYILPAIIDEPTIITSTTETTTSPTTTNNGPPPDNGPLFIGLSVGGITVVVVLIVYFVKKR